MASQVPRVRTRPGQLLPVADAIGRRTVLYVLPLHEVRQQVEGRLNTITPSPPSALSPSSSSAAAPSSFPLYTTRQGPLASTIKLFSTKPRYKPWWVGFLFLVGVFLLPDGDDDEGINDAKMSSRLPALAFFVFVFGFVATFLAAGEASSLTAGVGVAAASVVMTAVGVAAGFLVFFPGSSAAMMSSRLSLGLALLVAPAFAAGAAAAAADIDTALFVALPLGVVVVVVVGLLSCGGGVAAFVCFIDAALSAGAGVAGVEDEAVVVGGDDEAGLGVAAVAVVVVVVADSPVLRFLARAPTSRYLKADSPGACADGIAAVAFAFVFAFGVGVGVDAMGTSRGGRAAAGDGGTPTLKAALRFRDVDDGVDEAGVLVVAEAPTAAADEVVVVVVVEDEDAEAGKARGWEASV